jgi:hypothetical protein
LAYYHALQAADEVDLSGSEAARKVLAWVRDYLGAADADRARLGRKYVCPFIPDALGRKTLWFLIDEDVRDAAGSEDAARYESPWD